MQTYAIAQKLQPSKLNALIYYAHNVLGMKQADVALRFGITDDGVQYHCREFRNLSQHLIDSDVPQNYAKTCLMFYIPMALKATETMLRSNKRSKMVNSDGLFKFWQAIGVYRPGDSKIDVDFRSKDVNELKRILQDVIATVSINDSNIEEATIIEPTGPEQPLNSEPDTLLDSHLPAV